jgi:hypothetical protein
MVRSNSGRLKALLLCISVAGAGMACSGSQQNAGPGSPTTLPKPSPTPTPTPEPSPSPTPGASPSANGIHLDVVFIGSHECKRGVGPTGTEALRVGCSVEVDTIPKDETGTKVPERTSGNNVQWVIDQGGEKVTLPWDENPWRRWLTGIAPGHFRIVSTLLLRNGDKSVGVLDGEVVE